MTALLDSAVLDQAGDTGTTLVRLIRAEFMKIRTTSTGSLFLTGFIVFTAMALTINGFGIHSQLYPEQGLVSPAQAVAQRASEHDRSGVLWRELLDVPGEGARDSRWEVDDAPSRFGLRVGDNARAVAKFDRLLLHAHDAALGVEVSCLEGH